MADRNRTSVITLAIGLALNIALGTAKLVVGIISGSMSVMSDAFNNLSDSAVSVVTVVAVMLAARAADHDHPYGHGRYEYIATFILGAVIVAVGVEALSGGIKRAITPEDIDYSVAVLATLGVSVGVKLFMAVFYRNRGKATGSETIKAAAVDSLSDAAVTFFVLACALIERYVNVHIDGYVSIAVAIVILVFAVRILKRTVSQLLGERPDGELIEAVGAVIAANAAVISSHDLVINDYGKTKKIAEVDIVLPASMSFVDVHKVCDDLERDVYEKTGVRLTVHADPLITDDARLNDITKRVAEVLLPFGATAHDLGIDDCGKTVKLDITVPRDDVPVAEIKSLVSAEIMQTLGYTADIEIDY